MTITTIISYLKDRINKLEVELDVQIGHPLPGNPYIVGLRSARAAFKEALHLIECTDSSDNKPV